MPALPAPERTTHSPTAGRPVTGPVWAAVAGVGFGTFQAVNRRAVGGITDAYLSTFLQLVVALTVLVFLTLGTDGFGVLGDATAAGIAYFVGAGVVHFAAGWTFLNFSQMRIGAARSSPLFSTSPLWGVFIAGVWLHEVPDAVGWAGMALVVTGSLVVTLDRVSGEGWSVSWRDLVPGLATAFAWAVSPVLVKKGLDGLSSPLVGVTIGMVASVLLYAVALSLRSGGESVRSLSPESLSLKGAAGVLLGFSVWARWEALDFTTVAVVLSVGLLSVPTVLLLAPTIAGRHLERVTRVIWGGSALVVGGSLLLVLAG